jgi:NADH-ubiquinone oxidoreductase chain 5
MGYVNVFSFLLLFLSTGLTVCYSFRLFYYVMCGDFNFVSSCNVCEASYYMVFGMVALLIMSIFGGSFFI